MEQIELEVSKDIDNGLFNLVKGDFSTGEAKDILNHLIKGKINFHNRRNFSQEIRFGSKDEASVKRIKELQIADESINKIIQLAREQGKSLRIKSNVSIELI